MIKVVKQKQNERRKKPRDSLNSLSIAIMDHRLHWIFRCRDVIQLSMVAITESHDMSIAVRN